MKNIRRTLKAETFATLVRRFPATVTETTYPLADEIVGNLQWANAHYTRASSFNTASVTEIPQLEDPFS